ncbi:hypothetical protein O3P69_001428 [Scylla paramamosain]|uniref:Uncharacterized protein n=1 Tax=Scylla paramamosain TaxID=85552 RepID=A0AAW0UYN1_SCYPA
MIMLALFLMLSLSRLQDHWENVGFADTVTKFPASERVVLHHTGFVHPVILFGLLIDLAQEKILKENPGKYSSPYYTSVLPSKSSSYKPVPPPRPKTYKSQAPGGMVPGQELGDIYADGEKVQF